jgi:large subunit ribosomal protein L4
MPVSVEILNSRGEAAGTLELSDALFAEAEQPQAVRAALDCYLARQRHGAAHTLTRGEARGGGAKPWRQKGTGRARVGSRRSPIWTGGGTTFGPRPRDHGYRINRKVRRLALRSQLGALQREKRLLVLDKIELDAPKTRNLVALRERLGIDVGLKVLVLTDAVDPDLYRAARNLGRKSWHPTRVLPLNNMNVFDLLVCDYLILTTACVKALEELYA